MVSIALIMTALLACGCTSAASDPIVGNWSLTFMGQTTTMDFHGDNTFTVYAKGAQTADGHWTSEGNLKYLLTAKNATTGKDDSFMLDMTSDHKSFAYESAPLFSFVKQ